ncbi:MAG: Re/Si-specific NAD(P)(+) transhydrogenase subunit alpha [Pseudomonadota bacterium]
MVTIATLKEPDQEPRVALSPETAKRFVGLGCTVRVEAGAGLRSRFSDQAYTDAGADVVADRDAVAKGADLLVQVMRPAANDLAHLADGASVAAIMDPFDGGPEMDALVQSGRTLFSMEFIPRITRAQSMDVLSSQANLAGYKAVVDAASMFEMATPMMMTAAGTVPAAKIFIMGVGVAGLQAIATARRLGGVVSATDVRPATKEQVQSLGAKFVAVENDEFKEAQTAAGYAKPMSDAYQAEQRELIAKHITAQDIVITTALIPGRPAPTLVTKAMVETMKPGAVIIDLAAERGGNCELTKPGETIEVGGVRVFGPINLQGTVPVNASTLYAKNIYNFLTPVIDQESGAVSIDWEDEVLAGTAIARDGKIVHPNLLPKKETADA